MQASGFRVNYLYKAYTALKLSVSQVVRYAVFADCYACDYPILAGPYNCHQRVLELHNPGYHANRSCLVLTGLALEAIELPRDVPCRQDAAPLEMP